MILYSTFNWEFPHNFLNLVIQDLYDNCLLLQFFFQVMQFKGRQRSKRRRILEHIFLIIMPGISIFIVLPSVVFYLVEGNWTYIDSVYYTFASLATIGFGDFVNSLHGYEVEGKVGKWVWAYRGFTMLWLVFGLSFIFMIHSLIVEEIHASTIFPRVFRRSLRRSRKRKLNFLAGKKVGKSITMTRRKSI